MAVDVQTGGRIFRDVINQLIDKDIRFDEIDSEILIEVEGDDDLFQRDIEVYKYGVQCDMF
jgi:hypothetical protein